MKLFHMDVEELDALHQKMAALFLCAGLKGNDLDNAISAALNAALPEIETWPGFLHTGCERFLPLAFAPTGCAAHVDCPKNSP